MKFKKTMSVILALLILLAVPSSAVDLSIGNLIDAKFSSIDTQISDTNTRITNLDTETKTKFIAVDNQILSLQYNFSKLSNDFNAHINQPPEPTPIPTAEPTPAPTPSATISNNYIDITKPPTGYTACVGNGTVNNAVAFSALLDLATVKKCNLYVPVGIFLVNEFSLRPNVVIVGQSSTGSVLKLNNNRNTDFVTLSGNGNTTNGCGLTTICLDGSRWAQTGTWSCIKITTTNDGCIFDKIYLKYGGHGLTIQGAPYAWVYHFNDFLIQGMSGNGINGLGTDNSFTNFTIGGTEGYCVYASGANCRLINFKIMGSTKSSGIYINGSRLTFVGIDSQESYIHGVHFKDAYDCTITGLNCDNNGLNYPLGSPWQVKNPRDSYGVYIESGQYNTISDYNFSNRNSTIKYGIGAYYISSSATHYKIRLNDERNPFGVSVNNSPTSTIERN
jgi:hypothetical protein